LRADVENHRVAIFGTDRFDDALDALHDRLDELCLARLHGGIETTGAALVLDLALADGGAPALTSGAIQLRSVAIECGHHRLEGVVHALNLLAIDSDFLVKLCLRLGPAGRLLQDNRRIDVTDLRRVWRAGSLRSRYSDEHQRRCQCDGARTENHSHLFTPVLEELSEFEVELPTRCRSPRCINFVKPIPDVHAQRSKRGYGAYSESETSEQTSRI